jgi:hypothetical protein
LPKKVFFSGNAAIFAPLLLSPLAAVLFFLAALPPAPQKKK